MDIKTYTITLADGTVLDNLKLNGNNFISSKIVDPSIFKGNCSPVTISDETHEEIHDNMELVQVKNVNGDYWIVLRDISKTELGLLKIKSDIDYLTMMSGVEL